MKFTPWHPVFGFKRALNISSGIIITAALLFSTFGFAQLAEAATLFSDGFESNNFSNWTSSTGIWDVSNGATHTGSKKAELKGDTGSVDDSIIKNVSTVGKMNISVSYWYFIAAGLESNDYVKAEWSNDGTNWNTLATYSNINTSNNYVVASHSLPLAASNNAGFRVRFVGKLDSNGDAFRLDDVTVSGNTIPEETSLASCTDGIDNDIDGSTDLADTDCSTYMPKLTVTKVVVNDNGGTKVVSDFPLSVTLGTSIAFTSGAEQTLLPGTYSISESNASGYAASFSGNCSESGSTTLIAGGTYACTITNNDIAPTLKIVKTVTNDNGGDKAVSDFTLKIDGVTVSNDTATTLPAGAHVASEESAAGYNASVWGTDCAEDGSITLALGENKVCTITNDDIAPTLTVNLNIVNDNGGTLASGDVTLSVDAATVLSGAITNLNAGAHVVTSSTHPNYTQIMSGSCDASGNVTLSVGEAKTCMITLDDEYVAPPHATIIIKKAVINNNGGTAVAGDFTLSLTATDASATSIVGSDEGTSVTVSPGAYLVHESENGTYEATYSEDCDGDILADETKTCTVTNDDQPGVLTVTKVVVNDGGGTKVVSDFPLFVSETGVVSGDENEFNAGTYNVHETSDQTYSAVFTGDCGATGDITLGLGQEKSCTITNTFIVTPACSDGKDNDEDGKIDGEDPGCSSATDTDEYEAPASSDDTTTPPPTPPAPGAVFIPFAFSSGGASAPGSVLGASTTTVNLANPTFALPASCKAYLGSYIKYNGKNNKDDVMRLQTFLNTQLDTKLEVNGVYDLPTYSAVLQYQLAHREEILAPWVRFGLKDKNTPTGYVFKTTLWFINMSQCPALNLVKPL